MYNKDSLKHPDPDQLHPRWAYNCIRNPDKRVNFSACVRYAALLVSGMESRRTHYSNNAIILVEETEVWHNSSNRSGGINHRGLLTPGVNN